MPIPPVSRRKFIATGTTLLAGACIPSWSEAFQSTSDDAALRAEVADAALARAATLGASYADIRINRYRRESISTRERQVQNVSRSASYGLGLRVLVNGAWGFAATNRVEPAAARAAADQAVAIARANAALATRKVILANAEKVVTTWTSAFKRDPFEVPLDTKIAFLMKLNETAMAVSGVSFVSSQVLFVDEQKYFASSEGSNITQRLVRTYPQFSATAADRASGDFQTRAVVDRAQLVGYEYVEDYPWLRDAEKAGHEVVEKLKAKSVAAGRYDIVVDPSQLFLAIHESVGHSTELDRSLGWEANMAGTSFLKASDAGKLKFGSKIVNLVGDRTQPGGLATTGFDDEGVKADRWHIVRDGVFVDWQTTRELAPLVGQQRSHGCLHADSWSSVPFPRMPNVSLQPAPTDVTLDELFSDIKRGLFVEGHQGDLVVGQGEERNEQARRLPGGVELGAGHARRGVEHQDDVGVTRARVAGLVEGDRQVDRLGRPRRARRRTRGGAGSGRRRGACRGARRGGGRRAGRGGG